MKKNYLVEKHFSVFIICQVYRFSKHKDKLDPIHYQDGINKSSPNSMGSQGKENSRRVLLPSYHFPPLNNGTKLWEEESQASGLLHTPFSLRDLGRVASQLCAVEFLERNLSHRTLEPEFTPEVSLPGVLNPIGGLSAHLRMFLKTTFACPPDPIYSGQA